MHKDEMKGSARQAGGAMKEAAGKITGDEKLRREGAVDQAHGKVEKAAGSIKSAARDILKN